jgi:hypothetical protein
VRQIHLWRARPLEEVQMIGVSIYVPGPMENVGYLARHLLVPGPNICAYGVVRENFDFYVREENSMTYAPVSGDFGYLCDVDMFHVAQNAVIEMLRTASINGPMFAIPDERSTDPDDGLLFESGSMSRVQLRQDDMLDEVRIVRPAKQGS